jgi:two-component system, LuxR family, response regulator FixJ
MKTNGKSAINKINEIRVHVIDDDEAVRDSISMLLETIDLPHALYASAKEFLDEMAPDTSGCLVVDIRMPGMSGLELQEELNARQIGLPIIFITGHGDVPMAVEAMRRGALDFIRKPFREQDLLDRINEALDAEEAGRAARVALTELMARYESLSPREQEVFERVADGQANKVIAIDLGISERTVEIHRAQVMKKMAARTLAQLVRMKIALDRERT